MGRHWKAARSMNTTPYTPLNITVPHNILRAGPGEDAQIEEEERHLQEHDLCEAIESPGCRRITQNE